MILNVLKILSEPNDWTTLPSNEMYFILKTGTREELVKIH